MSGGFAKDKEVRQSRYPDSFSSSFFPLVLQQNFHSIYFFISLCSVSSHTVSSMGVVTIYLPGTVTPIKYLLTE